MEIAAAVAVAVDELAALAFRNQACQVGYVYHCCLSEVTPDVVAFEKVGHHIFVVEFVVVVAAEYTSDEIEYCSLPHQYFGMNLCHYWRYCH